MSRPNIQIGDEVREMTDAEFAVYKAQQTENARLEEEREAKKVARAAVLKKLKLSEEEVALLLG